MMIKGADYKEITYTKEQIKEINDKIERLQALSVSIVSFVERCSEKGIIITKEALDPDRDIGIQINTPMDINGNKVIIHGRPR